MKRALCLQLMVALVLILATLNLHAQQDPSDKKITFGLSLGANVSAAPALKSATEPGVPSDKGYGAFVVLPMAGVSVDFKIQNNLTLQTEANFSVKGGKREAYYPEFRCIEIPAAGDNNDWLEFQNTYYD